MAPGLTTMNLKPHHTAISVRSLEKSLAFYEQLGFKQVHRYDEADGSMSIVHLKLGEYFLEIFVYNKNREAPAVNYDYANNLEEIGVKHIALQTEDIEKSLTELKKAGLADEKTQITHGRTKVSYFFIKDPDGVWVEIVKDERYN